MKVKLHGKKKMKIVVRFIQWHIYNMYVRNGFFFHSSEISAVRHAYVTRSSLKRPIHVTRDIAVGQEFRCGLSSFVAEMKSHKDTTGAPNENIVQNHLNIALLNVF